jgi:hypothetical protein
MGILEHPNKPERDEPPDCGKIPPVMSKHCGTYLTAGKSNQTIINEAEAFSEIVTETAL